VKYEYPLRYSSPLHHHCFLPATLSKDRFHFLKRNGEEIKRKVGNFLSKECERNGGMSGESKGYEKERLDYFISNCVGKQFW
jgi:hypothetical protein